MLVRQKSEIHQLAIQYQERLEYVYNQSCANFNYEQELYELHVFLKHDYTDQEIVSKFEDILKSESDRKATGFGNVIKHPFLSTVKEFLDIVKLMQKREIEKNEHPELALGCTTLNDILFLEPKLLQNILFLINIDIEPAILKKHDYDGFNKHYKCLADLNTTSKLFKQMVEAINLKERVLDNQNNDVKKFYSYPSGSYGMHFKMLTGKTTTLFVNDHDTILHCKKAMRFFEEIPVETQIMSLNANKLENTKTIREYNIRPETTIIVIQSRC